MRLSKKIILVLSACIIFTAALGRYLFYAPVVEPPPFSGVFTHHVLDVGGLERRFAVYRPERPIESAAAIVVLHGSRGSGDKIRRASGFEFDTLADRYGFVVVYPDGYERHWNDCRAAARYSARVLNIDDVAFIRELTAFMSSEYAVDPGKIFAAGLSTGGQMAYRLALEAPDLVRGVAAIAANMPAQQNQSCKSADEALPVMIVNGTADRINPFNGGEVSLLGPFGSRGAVMSAPASAQYWSRLGGHSSEPFFHRYPDTDAGDGSVADRAVWTTAGRPEVALVTVNGGGHTIPGPGPASPNFLGPVNRDFSAIEEIWRFFARELERSAN